MQFVDLKTQFERYTQQFFTDNALLLKPLALKVEHCRRVAKEAKDMSSGLYWPAHEQDLAQAAGRLHDINRFSQLDEFGTFSGAASVNYGERGAAVLREAGWLSDWGSENLSAILIAVCYHNRLRVPVAVRGQPLDCSRS